MGWAVSLGSGVERASALARVAWARTWVGMAKPAAASSTCHTAAMTSAAYELTTLGGDACIKVNGVGDQQPAYVPGHLLASRCNVFGELEGGVREVQGGSPEGPRGGRHVPGDLGPVCP